MKAKKLLSLCLATALCAGSLSLFGCGNTDSAEKKVMNVSLNPAVEFVLDANDKVISVNANNEEGNLVISAEAFANIEGKTAEQAIELFVQVSDETGYLVKGNASVGNNNISISLSGDTKKAEELYNNVKKKAEEYFTKENITATVEKAKAVTEEELRKIVEEVAPYIDKAKVEAMKYSELMEEVVKSRKETAEFYSQEVKNAYYEAKKFAMEQAKLDVLKEHLPKLEQAGFTLLNNAYTASVKTVEETRKTFLTGDNSIYQKALAAMREKKIEYLNMRKTLAQSKDEIPPAEMDRLNAIYAAYEKAEAALKKVGDDINAGLDSLLKIMETNYNKVVDALGKVKVSDHLDEISAKCTEAQNTFFTEFETAYGDVNTAVKNAWKDMADQLKVEPAK